MNYTSAVSSVFSSVLRWDFTTRASRSEYWHFMLFILKVSISAYVIKGFLHTFDGQAALYAGWAVYGVVTILGYIASVNVITRRFHDIGRSMGWALLVQFYTPLMVGAVLLIGLENIAVIIGIYISMIIVSLLGIYWTTSYPDMGENQYGAEPVLSRAYGFVPVLGTVVFVSIMCYVLGMVFYSQAQAAVQAELQAQVESQM